MDSYTSLVNDYRSLLNVCVDSIIAISWLGMVCLAIPSHGQTDQPADGPAIGQSNDLPDDETVGEPAPLTLDEARARTMDLESEVMFLRSEVRRLRSLLQLNGLNPDASASGPSEPLVAVAPGAAGEQADSNLGPRAGTDGVDPDTGELILPGLEPPTYRTAAEILREMPREIMPNATRWDEFDRSVALNWLAENAYGAIFDFRVELSEVVVTPNPFHGSVEGALPWQVSLAIRPREFRMAGLVAEQHVVLPIFTVDEETAQRLDRLRSGMSLPIRGTIHLMDLQPMEGRRYEVRMELTDLSIDSPIFNPPERPTAGE